MCGVSCQSHTKITASRSQVKYVMEHTGASTLAREKGTNKTSRLAKGLDDLRVSEVRVARA